jgi:flagellar hook protein FlgE
VQAFASERAQDAFRALFDLQAARRQVEASAKVVKTGNQLLGNVLDIFA